MSIKKHNTMSPEMFYGTALGIVFGAVFKHIVFGMIIGGGIGSAVYLIKRSKKSNSNKK